MEPRVSRLENSHSMLQQELHQMNKTLSKIETAIEKQNEISADIRLLRQEFKGHAQLEEESTKRQNARLEKVEMNQSRVAWLVLAAVIGAVMTFILKAV